jgi:molybdate transport system substrate-binding protein
MLPPEIRILSSNILRGVLQEITSQFEREAACKLTITYGPPAEIKKSLMRGVQADIVLLGAPGIEDLWRESLIAAESRADIATNRIGIAVHASAAKPDIGSVEAVKRLLLDGRSIVYTDPAVGGRSGIHFAKVLERLGIAEQLKAKSILNDGSLSAELVARGEAEIAIQFISEIVPVQGVQLVGPLPEELQDITVVAGAITKNALNPVLAKAFIDFLKSPSVAPSIKARGMEPCV